MARCRKPKIKFKIPKLTKSRLQREVDYGMCSWPIPEVRVACLQTALNGWDGVLATHPKLRTHSLIGKTQKARGLAEGTSVVPEKEAALRTACRLMESIVSSEGIEVPSVDSAYQKEPNARQAKLAAALEQLGTILKDVFGIRLNVAQQEGADAHSITLSVSKTIEMAEKTVQVGPIPVVIEVAPLIVRSKIHAAKELGVDVDAWAELQAVAVELSKLASGNVAPQVKAGVPKVKATKAKTQKPDWDAVTIDPNSLPENPFTDQYHRRCYDEMLKCSTVAEFRQVVRQKKLYKKNAPFFLMLYGMAVRANEGKPIDVAQIQAKYNKGGNSV